MNDNNIIDNYNINILKKRYLSYKNYYIENITLSKTSNIKIRNLNFPEDISENIIKFIILKEENILSYWHHSKCDLYINDNEKIECKSFTSKGPISFSPKNKNCNIYFLDATNIINDYIILYKFIFNKLIWDNVKINKLQTLKNQCDQKRRPRITWNNLYPQIQNQCIKIFEGNLNKIINI